MSKKVTLLCLVFFMFKISTAFSQIIYKSDIRVLPEVTTKIFLSSSDVNRIVCEAPIKDVVFSQEKGITVKIEGKNAFIKFLVKEIDGKKEYSTTPSEFYVICDNTVYTMVAIPKRIPARTVRLVPPLSNKIKKNIEFFKSLPFEKRIVYIVKHVLKDDIPDTWDTTKVSKAINVYQDLDINLIRIFKIEGTGLRVKEFILRSNKKLKLKETEFLLTSLTKNPIGISLSSLNISKGKPVELIIIERVNSGGSDEF